MTKGMTRAARRFIVAASATMIGAAALATGAQGAHFLNPAVLTVPGGSPATPLYPSPIAVSGLTGKVSRVTATVSGLNNELDDIQILLAGPGGQTTVLWRAVCQDAANFTGQAYTFDDAAASSLPAMNCPPSGIYKPTDLDASPEPFSSPAPQAQPYGATLSAFNGTDPNGTWNLFVESTQVGGLGGSINAGWSLDIETVTQPATTVPNKKKKCKKKKKKRAAESAKKKKCKKKKKR
jgi:hypothetical protein